ncbi:ABC transporter ATP-binding protein [Brevibacterium sp.]|uniref:ABC transporter ATP-binding protein n=1 Tax=Brevibacterium sp. TaxID=1701 RepID=UPI0028112616|nr:ABC transporter ATP-binding protein [Brevibacterium sp.]
MRTASAPIISATNVDKTFVPGGPRVLDSVSFDVEPGEFVCLLGGSGCGKSTLLNLIAGIDLPTGGTLMLPGDGAAMMFQDSALMPWLSARHNVELALRLRGVPKRDRRAIADELLDMVHLSAAADRRPHELSGGMRQRVALARALAQERSVLLMDEPFAALDAITRDSLHSELERVWKETGRTIVFVTHNVREAMRLGDRILLMAPTPGGVVAEWRIDIDRPRAADDPRVVSTTAEITDRLRKEMGHERH